MTSHGACRFPSCGSAPCCTDSKGTGVRDKVSLICGDRSGHQEMSQNALPRADAVYPGTAALIAINCEQYRICHTGLCPTG